MRTPTLRSQFGWAADCVFDGERVFLKLGDTHKGYKLIESIEIISNVHQRRLALVKVSKNAK